MCGCSLDSVIRSKLTFQITVPKETVPVDASELVGWPSGRQSGIRRSRRLIRGQTSIMDVGKILSFLSKNA